MSTQPVPQPPGTPFLSWAPYGRGAMTVGARTVPMSPVMSTRVSMAPVQVNRSTRGESGPAVTMAPVSMAPVTMSPVPAPPAPRTVRPPAPPAPASRTAAPSTQYRTAGPQTSPRTAAPTAFETTTRRTAARRTHRPTQAERTAARGARTAGRGYSMPPPPPGARRGAPAGVGYPRPEGASSRAAFDPLAIVAIIASFIFGPVGLFLALTSIGRARKSGAALALSVIALLVGVAMTASQLGLAGMLADLATILP